MKLWTGALLGYALGIAGSMPGVERYHELRIAIIVASLVAAAMFEMHERRQNIGGAR